MTLKRTTAFAILMVGSLRVAVAIIPGLPARLEARANEFGLACVEQRLGAIYRLHDSALPRNERISQRRIIAKWRYSYMEPLAQRIGRNRARVEYRVGRFDSGAANTTHYYYWVLRDGDWYVTIPGPWCGNDSAEVEADTEAFAERMTRWKCNSNDILTVEKLVREFLNHKPTLEVALESISAYTYLQTMESTWDAEAARVSAARRLYERLNDVPADSAQISAECWPGYGHVARYVAPDAVLMRDGPEMIEFDKIQTVVKYTGSDGRTNHMRLTWVPEGGSFRLWQIE